MSDPCTECGQDTGHFSYLIDGNPAKRICNACYIYKEIGSPSPEAAEIARLRASLTATQAKVGEAERERDALAAKLDRWEELEKNALRGPDAVREDIGQALAHCTALDFELDKVAGRKVQELAFLLSNDSRLAHARILAAERDQALARAERAEGRSLHYTAIFLAETWTKIHEWYLAGLAMGGDELKDHFFANYPIIQTMAAQNRITRLAALTGDRSKIASEIDAALGRGAGEET
jgi:hypothetical protein